MKESCPVCNTEYSQNMTKCNLCGFADDFGINRKWPIAENAENWFNTVVKPYRMEWHKQIREIQTSVNALGEKNDTKALIIAELGTIRKNLTKYEICVSTETIHTVGLKTDGTVVAVGDNRYGQCNTANWRDIVAISSGSIRTVGLKADGTVVAVGYNEYGQCNTADWRDIVAIFTSENHTVGLKTDGTVVAVGGYDNYGECNVTGWRDIGFSKGNLVQSKLRVNLCENPNKGNSNQ